MKQEVKQVSEQFARFYVVTLIQLWRARFYVETSEAGMKYPRDCELAELVNVTPATFSRISTGVVTCSLSVLCRILKAISSTRGEAAAMVINRNALYCAFKKFYYGNS